MTLKIGRLLLASLLGLFSYSFAAGTPEPQFKQIHKAKPKEMKPTKAMKRPTRPEPKVAKGHAIDKRPLYTPDHNSKQKDTKPHVDGPPGPCDPGGWARKTGRCREEGEATKGSGKKMLKKQPTRSPD
ncbi:MAG TPA: hypothetical protein VFN26_15440 [Candidatus Acidoferrum sp.]|nr:hypothetical protein [Candidatus Acidoferrum sp.]